MEITNLAKYMRDYFSYFKNPLLRILEMFAL